MPSISIPPAAPLFIALNVGSGHDDATQTRARIEGVLTAAGRSFELQLVEDPSRLADISRVAAAQARACGGVVVAAGGDGTINAVAQAAHASGCPLGVLPQGTFNYFSRAHGIPADTVEATRLLLTARACPVQVGLVNERLFLVNASLGLYPQLLEDREAAKQEFGRSRPVALAAALVTLLRQHRQLQLHIENDGQAIDMRTPTLFVGNNALQLEQFGFAQAPVVVEGRLVAVAPRPVGTLAMLWLLLRGALGRLGDADNVTSFAFRRISVTAGSRRRGRPVKVATDGEIVWLDAPIEFRVAPEPLYLLKPDLAPSPEPAP